MTEGYSFKLGEDMIHLIDTPGFDDTHKSDTDVLKDIAGWLSKAYEEGVRLSGLVYLHSIGETRMKGSHLVNIRMFKRMTGLDNMEAVLLATSMWDKTDDKIAKDREEELITRDEFWGSLIRAKSTVKRFHNDDTSAMSIITMVIEKHHKVKVELQKEMAEDKMDLNDTAAGKELTLELDRQKERYEARLKETEE